MPYNENLNHAVEALPGGQIELKEQFDDDRRYLMRLAARLTHAAQSLDGLNHQEKDDTPDPLDKLTQVVNEINKVTARIGDAGLKLMQPPETTPDSATDGLEIAT
jgi:hypothetical protein